MVKIAGMRSQSTEERKALGAFLVSRRARLKPVDPGASHGQRRTPGLRREEVAALAGISVSWYTWLEQGREIRVSAATLQRLASVLHLDRAETEHLLALSAQQPSAAVAEEEPSDGLLKLVQAIDPVPAYIRNDRLDILAWNPAIADLFVDYGALDPQARNTLLLMFLHQPYRNLIDDWEHVAGATVRLFRAGRTKVANKAPFDRLIEELDARSPEFRHWWAEVDVEGFYEGAKRLHHPTRGLIDLTYVALTPEGRPELSLVTYLPSVGAGDPRS